MDPTGGRNSSCPHCEGYGGWKNKIIAASNKVKSRLLGDSSKVNCMQSISVVQLYNNALIFSTQTATIWTFHLLLTMTPMEPLQITLDLLRQHLYRLSFDTGAGKTSTLCCQHPYQMRVRTGVVAKDQE